VTDRDALVEIIKEERDRSLSFQPDALADAILAWMQAQRFRRVDAGVIWKALRDAKANSDLVRAADVERALLATANI
jgi:hypothetical protein